MIGVPFSSLLEGTPFVYDQRFWVKRGDDAVGYDVLLDGAHPRLVFGDTVTTFTTADGRQLDPDVTPLRAHPG